ncbi:TetR/AcrR family transcriptional regulator [Pseudomonas qingdaonensis]|nr:TetR/AcrR family transcriptional regulator [Pseudomonas qingdaonensis]
MRTLTPSAQKVCAIAVEQFAEHGYDAASLNDIAAAAGMRKPSLYAHFSSKDDLFEAVFERAVEAERLYVEQCFAQCDDALPGPAMPTACVSAISSRRTCGFCCVPRSFRRRRCGRSSRQASRGTWRGWARCSSRRWARACRRCRWRGGGVCGRVPGGGGQPECRADLCRAAGTRGGCGRCGWCSGML